MRTESRSDGSLRRCAIALVPRGAIIVGAARREIVDTGPLVAAIHTGALHGALLATSRGEPEVPPNIRHGERIVLTPHVARRRSKQPRASYGG